MNAALLDYIAASPTAYHAVAHTAELLEKAGYTALCESGHWALRPGGKYYVMRNGSSLIAFRVPHGEYSGFMMTAAHCDSPCFKVKENGELADEHYVRLSTERYGGMLCASWMDRPLALAGRVVVRTGDGFAVRLVDLKDCSVLIPNVAIHMNREANDGMKYNAAVDMLPLYGASGAKGSLRQRLAACAGVEEKEILATDLFVYNPQAGCVWNGFVSAPRLDDLQCAFAALTGFMEAEESGAVPVYCLFDNEEVGSQTKQGAASTFLRDVLCRIAGGDEALRAHTANSFMVSCDNAHAVHPNHPEYQDRNHAVYMNGGVVIKYNANQRYTSDAVSAALFRLVCEQAGVPVQQYANRADLPGGSTLGNIANTQVSLNTVDIGLPQLAMHSAYETAGAEDTEHMVCALRAFYGKSLRMERDGTYQFK
ncbi:MAG: M18 family aminopeptidase [Oscillospiraceae bacterium]|nr:M18 family aminopeptidase [Oscillospiraceae bacterium]